MNGAYHDFNRKHRRLSILRVLDASDGFCANDSLVFDLVNEFGVVSTRAQIRTELLWLQEQGFVTVKEVSSAMVATMTERGGEIVAARATHPDIAKPKPKG